MTISSITNRTTNTEQQEQFINAAQERMQRKRFYSPVKMPNQKDPEFIKTVKHLLSSGSNRDEFHHGGQHDCVSTNKIPGFVFKYVRSQSSKPKEKMDKRVEMMERARAICEKHNLFLLAVYPSALSFLVIRPLS